MISVFQKRRRRFHARSVDGIERKKKKKYEERKERKR